MSKEALAIVIDPHTGEQIDTIYENDRILRGKSYDKLSQTEPVESDKQFVKLFVSAADSLSRAGDLTLTEMRVCLRLLQYIRYETGLIAFENGIAMGVTDIKGLFEDVSSRAIDMALSGLVEKNVFAKVTQDRKATFYANPYMFMRGKKLNKELLKLFPNKKLNIKPKEKGGNQNESKR